MEGRRYTQQPRSTLWLFAGGEVFLPERPAVPCPVEPFYVSTTPITNAQYIAFDPRFRPSPKSFGPNHPATGVSILDARAYCAWYAVISGKAVRLPSEEEWQLVCDASYAKPLDATAITAWHAGVAQGHAHPVGEHRRLASGLYDVLGNVWEWVDVSSGTVSGAVSGTVSGTVSGAVGIARGGSFLTPPAALSTSLRRQLQPETQAIDVGFRVARSLRGG